MASKSGKREEVTGEILVAWQKYKACGPDELNLREGDVVELLDTIDPGAKRLKLDPEFEGLQGDLLDHSAAKHKLSVKPRRTYTSSRHSPTRLNTNARWLVREISGGRKEGWVPCKILQTIDDPTPGGAGLPGDAAFRRQAVVKELVETEQEFVKDLDYVVQNYLIKSEGGRVPKIIKDNFDVVFSNLKEIAEFHRTVLMEGLKYYSNEPLLLGKAFLRLERDFDKHVNYCKDEPSAQIFLESSDAARTYFEDLSQRLGDDKSIAEHLKLPIQRINDYQLLIKELVRYSSCLGEDHGDLQKALELMLSIPHRAQDDKFTSSIEGYRGSIYKLGRLLAHDWFSVTFSDITKERYLFLFKARILICKVRRISDDRSVFQLKDIVRLTQVEVRDHPEEDKVFELVDKSAGHSLILTTHRERIKEYWLQEIREFAKDYGESEESDEFQIASPPTEASNSPSKPTEIPNPPTEPTKSVQEHTKDSKVKETTEKKKDSNLPVKRQLEDPEQKPLKHKENPATKSAEKVVEPEKKSENKENLPPKKPEENKESNSQVKRPLEDPHPTQQKRKPSNPSLTSEKPKEVHTSSTAERTASIKATEDSKSVTVVKVFTREEATVTKALEQTSSQSSLTSKTSQETTQVGKQEEHHTHHLKAVEPLVHISDHRVLEQPVPFTPPVAPELVPGSAYNKVLSVEKVSASDKIVDGDFRVGVEINVEVDDMSSRKYTSSALSGGYESSYGRKSASYSSEGGYSSRHSGEITSGRYGTDSAGTGVSKYDEISSKYSKSYTDEGDTGYTSNYARKSLTGAAGADDAYSKYTRRSVRSSAAEDDDSGSFSRRSIKGRRHDSDGDSYSYARKSVTALTGSSLESKDGDNYTYSRKSIRASADLLSDGDSYVMQKSLTKSHDGSGEIGNTESYSYTKKGLLGDEKSYSKRSLGGEDDFSSKYGIKSTSAAAKDDEEDIYSKYSRKYSRTESLSRKPIEEEDYQSKYSRKYSRNESVDNNKAEEEDAYTRYKRKYSRTDSQQEKKSSTNDDEDVYAKYTRKYSRTESADKKSLNEEDSKYSRSYSRTDSADKKKVKDAEESKYSREYSRTDSSESKSKESEELKYSRAYSRTESAESKNREEDVPKYSRSSSKVDSGEKKSKKSKTDSTKIDDVSETRTALKEETVIINGQQNVQSEIHSERVASAVHEESLGSISTSLKMSRESESVHQKTATEKLLELDEGDVTAAERAERTATDRPEFLVSLKDTELLEDTYLRFMVKVRGDPNPDITFFKDGVKIPEDVERIQIIREHSDLGFYELVIPDVKHTDAGSYKCVATNKFGEASSEATVTVTDNKQAFEDMPEGEILEAGKKPSFLWKKDGQPFEPEERFKVLMGDDEDSLALVFQHVRPDDVGLYTCVAQTSQGHISCSAELTVHGTVNQLFREPEKPQLIIDKREPIVVNIGGSAMLELQVKGFPRPNVKVTHKGKSVEASDKYKFLYEDEESMSLVIKKVDSEDAGIYTITAENDLGTDTAEMSLIVKAPPKIKAKVQNVDIHADLQIQIPVEVEGIPKPTVHFYKDGKEIKKSDRIKLVEEAEKHILIIEKCTLKDTGSYSIVAQNELAQVSDFWSIDVHSKPKLLEKLGKDKQVSQGEKVDLKVKIEAEPKAEVKWFKDEEEIKSSEHFVIKEEAGGSYTMRITGAVTTDSSRYKVKAVNIHGSVEDEVRIDVKKAPKIIKSFSDMTVTEHDKNVTFDVSYEAFPKPTIKWYLDEMEITETKTEFTRIESDDGAKLVIKEVSSELSGKYTCKLSNECGAVETSAKLTVNCAPRIIKHLKDTTVDEGATLHLEIEVEACPTPTVKWLRNGREISADARIKISRDTQRYETYNLAVNLIKYEEQGEYEVYVTNALGTVSSKSYVTVQKVTHTDAVEETEEPEKKLQFKVVESDEEREIEPKETDSKKKAEPTLLDTNMKDGSRPESLDITYIVRGTANPLPVATWTHNGQEIKPDGHLRMTASQNGEEFKLEIKKLELKDAGTYQCTLSNALGEVKQQAVLEVTPEKELRRPKLKKGIEDQTIVKKNSVTFKAVVIGEPVPEVTWFKDGKEMTSAEYEKHKIILESEDHDIEDTLKECTYSLTIPRCERCNAGKYTMKAKNKWGECDSSAELTIILRPEIEGPEDVTVIPGEATQFTCIVQSNPVPEVTWLKDGQKVVADEAIEIIEDAANETYKLIFHKVKLADDGYYVVSAKNHLGESSSEARLKTITERPKIITGLEDEPVEDGGEVTVMVRADGLPKPEIRWFFMGKPIVEDENHIIKTHTELQVVSSLTIKNYKLSDVGLYKAVAVNCVGEADSNCKISMLQTPPSFIRKLERSEEINEGEPLELKTKISGSPKPTVAWYKNGELISPDDDRIKTVLLPDGTVKLNIESVKPEDSGAYKLVVKNANGENSCLCAVAVQPKPRRPKFLKCIKDTKVAVAEQLRLEAQIEAYPPPDIKWLKDGLPVRPSSNINIEKHPDGRVALVIDCMKPENAGRYEIMVTNRLGEATGEAKVEVEKKPTKPEFATLLQPQTVVEGFPVKFEVKAKAFPPPKITWIRNGAEVVSDNKHIKIIEQPDGTSALLIDSADIMRDALTYRAVAINEAGECETSALLTITPATNPDAPEERPLFLHGLRDVITDEGQPLILSAPFTGNPIPSVEWWKDGTKLEPSERMLMTCDGKKVGLTIDSALPSDAGQYSVTLENPLGKESSEAKASVHKVFMPPSFTQRFTDLQQLPKRDAKFPCRVSGVPQPDVTWSKDGVNLGESDKYHMKRDGDLCCLYVLNCEPEDAGVYRATATNKEGQDVCTATLEVVEEIKSPQKVEPPVFLKRIGDTELYKGMTAKFTACASGFPEPKVEWFHNDEKIYPSSRIRMETDTAGLLRLSILGIDQDDLGKYSCKISNDHGSDICHATLDMDGSDAKTKRPIIDQYIEYDKYKRSGAPMPLSDAPIISQMTDRHCTLSWRPSIPSAPRAPVTYQLEMCELPTGDWFTVRSGIRSCICDVRNLEPFRDYKFRIRVENKYGISDPSPYAITHREKLEPDLPKFRPYLPPEIDFRPETSPYFPRDFDIERPPHDNMAQAPRFLRQEHDTQYGVKDQNTNLFWFVYGYPKPNMSFYFNDELIEPGGRFDTSYTRNGQATLFINKMLDRDVGWYEAVARNEHGEARQRVRLDIAEIPTFIRRPDIEYVMLRGRARFEARILGVPYPEIKWYKDWKPLAISSRTKIQFVEPDVTILIINDVIGRDEGLYSVSARNVAGSTSSSAMLHIEENDHEYSTRTYANLCPIKAKRRPYTDLYDIGDELGRGTQGVTYHAVERLNGRNYAAKMMYGRDELRPFMYNELDMLNELHHRRLISLHDSYEHDDSLVLILELGAGGELVRDHLLRQEYYTESDISGYIRQLLQGLHYMHDRGYAHLGLNLGDLLISHAGGDELKITDFGLTRRISMANTYPLKYGMPEYVSPECASGLGVGFGHDMWSVGIITFILLSGRSPFRGIDDMETLTRIREGRWLFEEEWWSNISLEARDFISKLLVYQVDGRMDVYQALRHPWLERADKQYRDEFRIRSSYLDGYWRFYREWYDNASCKRWFRRRPLEGAFTHPSRMVYPPNERYTPPPVVPKADLTSWEPRSWEDQLPSRSPLNYEIGAFRSESHYQNGPDTYLLQLRDVDFPVRLREYMKVAANRGPGSGYIVSDENGYDWRTPIIRERRRFTDIMDEEIDDERKARINRYGADEATAATTRRLKHELGSRLDTYVEAEAFLESKHDGRLPFFREKPQFTAMVEAKDLELTCLAVGEPEPIVQWFKNDAIIAESHRIKIYTDQDGRSHFKLSPALAFDQGLYKVVARNKIGQTVARTRIVYGMVPDEPDSPQAGEVSSTEILLTWKLPKFDGHSPVLCYRLDYKLADGMDWTKKADNIDHEFYLFTDLQPNSSYIFRLAAKNEIGWSDSGVPSAPIQTKSEGAPRIQLSKAMLHLQQITDSGQDIEIQRTARLNYSEESNPVEWREGNAQEQYDFISEISSGRFSSVLKAIDKQTDQVVIVKLLEFSPERQEDVEGEFAALRSLRNERVASLLAAYRSTENQLAVFILEKLQGADVLTYLASRHEYTEQTVATIVSQTLDGLQYLHWRGLCHLDLQPDNIVMCNMRSVQIKLVDLGSAHRVTKMGTKVPVLGHPDYISPEVLSEEPAFPQTDIWTVGVLTYLMLSGTPPFKGENEQETKQNILFVRYRFEHLYQEISQEATRFIMLLFKRHPNKRPSAEECHENRWLLPTDCMIKKRERAVFLGHRLQEYSEEYHKEKTQSSPATSSKLGGKSLIKSHSIQEELLTAP